MSSKAIWPKLAAFCALALSAPTGSWAAQSGDETAVTDWNSGNYPRSIALWLELAKVGDRDALYNLGQVFRLGRGVTPNPQAALGMYRKAAEAGHPRAAEQLGLLLYELPGRRNESYPWLEKAAAQGSAAAHYILGIEYAAGESRPRDLAIARLHLQLAADAGVEAAARPLALVRLEMTPADRNRHLALALDLGI